MTKDQAKIILLERALEQACNSVDFLDNCLINGIDKGGIYNYIYPEQMKKLKEEWQKLLPERGACFHSGFEEACESCRQRNQDMLDWREARKTLK